MAALSGKTALVTGGCRGIGAAISQTLCDAGASVVVTARNRKRAEAFASDLGLHHRGIALDLTDASSAAEALADLGPVDILINNAGAAESAPFMKSDLSLFHRMLSVNLLGTVAVTQAVLPGMTERRAGRIITIASTAGLVGYAYVGAYVAAKHAVIGLTRSLALELAGKGVTVNAVCPGYTDTDLVSDAASLISAKTGRSPEEAKAEMAKVNPQGRLVDPKEVADAVLWLAGDGASAVTGQAIRVAGGEVMG